LRIFDLPLYSHTKYTGANKYILGFEGVTMLVSDQPFSRVFPVHHSFKGMATMTVGVPVLIIGKRKQKKAKREIEAER